MAEKPICVLFQWRLGQPWLRASEEEKKRANESAAQVQKKWKSSGVQLIAYFDVGRGLKEH